VLAALQAQHGGQDNRAILPGGTAVQSASIAGSFVGELPGDQGQRLLLVRTCPKAAAACCCAVGCSRASCERATISSIYCRSRRGMCSSGPWAGPCQS
jgi:hypothetical protein